MGTRGAIGFLNNGKGKITYNHYDSYPEVLGIGILEEIKGYSVAEMKDAFDKIKLIKDDNKKPTKTELKKFNEFSDPSVGSQGMSNQEVLTYYQLLRNVQGSLLPYLDKKVNLMIDSEDFLKDSLFCEWAYIVNLDDRVLEVWKGFQKTFQKGNRYGENLSDGYYPCKLIRIYHLEKLPEKEKFLKDLKQKED